MVEIALFPWVIQGVEEQTGHAAALQVQGSVYLLDIFYEENMPPLLLFFGSCV